jgi:myosin-6
MFLNEGTLLHNLKLRYVKDKIYTYTANILLALNPYHTLDMYTHAIVKSYQGKSLGTEPPHSYAIADKAYRDMRNLQLSQSIMCSGESGAGKTESTKHLLRYLTDSYGGGGVDDLEQRILGSNPLLEAYGNAKTTRNSNSSRFGKFIELHFNKNSKVVGAYVEHYLLEKSRVISQGDAERNYQVFYAMLRGAPAPMMTALNLKNDCTAYEYTLHGVTGEVPGRDDAKEFALLETSMTDCGLTPDEKSNIFRVTAAVLHVGNVKLEESGDGTKVQEETKPTLLGIAAMLGLDADAMEKGICYKTIQIGKEVSDKGLGLTDAQFGLNALAKAVYSKLFDWVVARCNKCFPYPPGSSINFIGILDIAGFEYFQHNSFEQFCINYCNEKLQQFFNERVLKDEQELYVRESIKFKEVEFVDNGDIIDMIENTGGILNILDDESKLPKASDAQFCDKLHEKFLKHFRLQLPRKSKMAYYKQMKDNEGFIVRHFAGAVCYETEGFMGKNNDALSYDMYTMIQTSKDPFMKEIFTPVEGEKLPKQGKLTLISLGTKFKAALASLMSKLQSTRASFVRCIKPNQKFIPKEFTGGEILSQLQCAGMVTVMDLMQGGFPSRTAFAELYDMYKAALPPALAKLDPRTFAKALFKALGLNEADFQFGVSKVFFRPGKFAEFDQIMKADPENLVKLVDKVLLWLVKGRWKKITWATVSCLKFAAKIRQRGAAVLQMQALVKMYFEKKQHLPRAHGLATLTKITDEVSPLRETVEKLPKNKDKFMAQLDGLLQQVEDAKTKVRTDITISEDAIKAMESTLHDDIDKQLAGLRKEQEKQNMAEEAEKLRKAEEAIAAEKAAKEAGANAKVEQLAELDKKKDMEGEAKQQAEEAQKAEEKALMKAEAEASSVKGQAKSKAARDDAAQEREALEQERRDQELAMRLALDAGGDGTQVLSDDAKAQAKTGQAKRKKKKKADAAEYNFANKKQAALHKKHNLEEWKYADLRDTINTSQDLDLLEACREEFHRRLKVYHAWKMKNMNKDKGAAKAKPAGLGEGPAGAPKKKKKGGERPQRYFRIPFVRPDAKGGKKGWWFAHFDGQWIARQLELHPEKAPVVLVQGKDDMEMCELSLDETGLSRKRGAEILPREFEDEWRSSGGKPYSKMG